MEFYIYEIETSEVVEEIEGETNEECETSLSNYDMETHAGTYSPAFGFEGGLTR